MIPARMNPRPRAQKIHPIGLVGRRDARSAPTVTIADPPIGLSGLVSLDSSGLNTLFGIGGAPDVSVVNLNAEIAIVTGTSPNEVKMTTETFTLRVNNDIFR